MQPFPPRFATDPVPVRRRIRPQLLLYLATAATTFAAGVVGWEPVVLGIDDDLAGQIGAHWPRGLAYMLAVMGVLSAHEAGHFVAAGAACLVLMGPIAWHLRLVRRGRSALMG